MSKKKNKKQFVKIPLPKWAWWQVAIITVVIIFAFRVESDGAAAVLKHVISMWVK